MYHATNAIKRNMQRNNAVVLQCGATCNIQQCAAWCGQGCDVARHSLRESVVEESICEREYIGVPRVVLDHLLLLLFHSYVVATARHGCNASVLHRSCTELSAAARAVNCLSHLIAALF